MRAYKNLAGVIHGFHVKSMRHMVCEMPKPGRSRRPVEDAVPVFTGHGMTPNIKSFGPAVCRPYGNIFIQIMVERIHPSLQGIAGTCSQANDLPNGMNTGIGPTRCRNSCLFSRQLVHGLFYLSLYSAPVCLVLGTVVPAAVIFHYEHDERFF